MKILVCYTYVSEKHSHGMGDTIVTMTGQLTEYAVKQRCEQHGQEAVKAVSV